MADFDAELAYFRITITEKYKEVIEDGGALPPEALSEVVESGPFNLDEDIRRNIIRQLEASFTTSMSTGTTVKSDYRPWLKDRRNEIDFFYWPRLKQYYMTDEVLPPSVVSVLDNVTDEVLDYCGNPEDTGAWSRRGMVMGHVQSGKTTNYASLICKAADAGYKVIILLAGITNSLRAQTQERLDEAFIGKKSIFVPTGQTTLPITRYGTGRFPAYGTTRDKDFSKGSASTYGVTLAALNEPIIFVTKKNKSTLENLRDWLRDQGHGAKILEPLLLIDDEADNASINTIADPDRVTAINRVMRETLNLFDRSSYVGYTATPFANIFIDPDTDDAMLNGDLFPKHFIKALDPPSNYVGAQRVFNPDGDLRNTMVRVVSDYQDLLPLNHKIDHQINVLPESMREAIRVFLLARTIRGVRDDGKKHSSMMINVSRFNNIQEKMQGLVYSYLDQLRNSLAVNGGMPLAQIRDRNILNLHETWKKEFGESELEFELILRKAGPSSDTISVVTVNMRGGALDYSRYKEDGLHVIAIGGLALSRGLTLEGLTVSYILRNTAASDTLMQMARWFGYRTGYEDLCRVYLPETSLDYYEFIDEAIEELRDEVKRMEYLGLTPSDFGLKVRQSPLGLRITAANKMRTATSMVLAQDYSGRHIEGHVLFNDEAVNRNNERKVQEFLNAIGRPEKLEADGALAWLDVSASNIMNLVGAFSFPPTHADLGQISGTNSLFRDYLADRSSGELAIWDVALPYRKTGTATAKIMGHDLSPRRRESGEFTETYWRATKGKNRIADPDDAKLLLAKEAVMAVTEESGSGRGDGKFCRIRKKPLLLIHMIGDVGFDERCKIKPLVFSLSFCLPPTSVDPISRTYQVSVIYREQLALNFEPDDDEKVLTAHDGPL